MRTQYVYVVTGPDRFGDITVWGVCATLRAANACALAQNPREGAWVRAAENQSPGMPIRAYASRSRWLYITKHRVRR